METAICKNCGPKPISEFYRHATRGFQSLCKQCKSEYNQEHYRRNAKVYKQRALQSNRKIKAERRRWIMEYLAQHPCTQCGEDDPVVLDFHHKSRRRKVQTVSNLISRLVPWEQVLAEIKKCEVLCANCHRRRTARQLGWRGQSRGEAMAANSAPNR